MVFTWREYSLTLNVGQIFWLDCVTFDNSTSDQNFCSLSWVAHCWGENKQTIIPYSGFCFNHYCLFAMMHLNLPMVLMSKVLNVKSKSNQILLTVAHGVVLTTWSYPYSYQNLTYGWFMGTKFLHGCIRPCIEAHAEESMGTMHGWCKTHAWSSKFEWSVWFPCSHHVCLNLRFPCSMSPCFFPMP